MNQFAYFYVVQEVRKSREGNIAPALINIEESKKILLIWDMIFMKKDGHFPLLYLGIIILKKQCFPKRKKMMKMEQKEYV